mmetsp:Transcript_25762/g.54199  ORF Transcript_25762/g.54199 Transcript_25762/m.54199 type:complete len:320 (+) Transcript_25762:496-1455(+)
MRLFILIRRPESCQTDESRDFRRMLRLISLQAGLQRRRRRGGCRPKRLPGLDVLRTGKSPIQTHHVHQPGIDALSYIRRKCVGRIPHQGHAAVPVVRPDGQARAVPTGWESRPFGFGESIPFVRGDEPVVGKVESGKGPLEIGSHGGSVPNGPNFVIRPSDDVGGSYGIVVFHGQESEGEEIPRSVEGGANGVYLFRGGLDGRFAVGIWDFESGWELQYFDSEVGGRRGVFFDLELFGRWTIFGPLVLGRGGSREAVSDFGVHSIGTYHEGCSKRLNIVVVVVVVVVAVVVVIVVVDILCRDQDTSRTSRRMFSIQENG